MAGGPPLCPAVGAQYGQLAHLAAYVPFPRPALFYDCPRQPRPLLALALLFLLRAVVAYLDRAVVREPVVVVLALVPVGSPQEPGGQCVSLSLARRAVVTRTFRLGNLQVAGSGSCAP
jgi:hypothetical protein